MDTGTLTVTTDTVQQALIKAIMEQQEISGEPLVSVDGATCPFADLPDFDSLRAISTMMSIESALQRRLKYNGEPFSSLTKKRNPTVADIAQAICVSMKKEC